MTSSLVHEETIKALLNVLNIQHLKKEHKQLVDLLKSNEEAGKRFSIKEYGNHVNSVLTEDYLKVFLEKTGCSHLFLVRYPEAKGDETIDWLKQSNEQMTNTSLGESSEGESAAGFYIDDLLNVLDKINIPGTRETPNQVRLNFNNFLDLCWEAVGLDRFGLGKKDKVFNAQRDLKPNELRKLFLGFIRGYLTKNMSNEEIGEDRVEKLGKAFDGNYS